MKFACDCCATKYVIPDDRVVGRVLRVRCKKCRSVMEVVGPSTSFTDKKKVGTKTEKLVARGQDVATDRPLLSARHRDPFAQAGGSGAWAAAGADMDVRGTGGSLALARSSAPRAMVSTHVEDAARWYVAIKGECRGPFTHEEMDLLAARGRIHTRSRVWRSGQETWRRLEEVTELEFLRGKVRTRDELRATPPPVPGEVGSTTPPPVPMTDEITGLNEHAWDTSGRPFANLLASKGLIPTAPLTPVEETPAPVSADGPGLSTGGTGWFVVREEDIERVLEQTPDRHVPGSTPMVTGSHLIKQPTRHAFAYALVGGVMFLVAVLAILGLPTFLGTSGHSGPAVKDITARTQVLPPGTVVEGGASGAQVQQIEALGAARPVTAQPVTVKVQRRNVTDVTRAMSRHAEQLLADPAR